MEKEKMIQEIKSVIESVDVDSLEDDLIKLIEQTFSEAEDVVLQELASMKLSLERERERVAERTRKYISRVQSVYANRFQLDFGLRNEIAIRTNAYRYGNLYIPLPKNKFYEKCMRNILYLWGMVNYK